MKTFPPVNKKADIFRCPQCLQGDNGSTMVECKGCHTTHVDIAMCGLAHVQFYCFCSFKLIKHVFA